MFALTFVAAIEYFFFEEFDARLNLVAVDYLMYPTEVVGDIWAAYPVVIGAGNARRCQRTRGLRIASASCFRKHGTAAASGSEAACSPHSRRSRWSARWASKRTPLAFSDNRVANEIAANGASSFFRALRTNEIDYHTYYASRSSGANLKRPGGAAG